MDFLTFFGLKEDPFKLSPDPAYFFPSSSHNEGLLLMDYSIDQREGFLLIIGDPGTGKTTLLKVFLQKWTSKAEIAIVLTPRLSPEEFLASVTEDLGIDHRNKNKNELIKSLRDFMTRQSLENRRVIIIVDEAQNLPDETLEELRLLSNLETDKDKLLQIILLGQPELESKLSSDSLRQLNQRIVTRINLQHFNLEETRDYINYRVIKAGKENLKIHNKAMTLVFKITGGVPRLINMLISRALMAAYLEESNTVLQKHIHHAVKSLNHTEMQCKRNRFMVPLLTGAAALLAIGVAAFLYLAHTANDSETVAASVNTPAASASVDVPDKEMSGTQPVQDSTVYAYTPPLKVVAVTVDIAIIRNEPSIDGNKAGWSPMGSQLVVLDEATDSSNSAWYAVPHQGEKRWISAEVVEDVSLSRNSINP